jgi:hypothetical protein
MKVATTTPQTMRELLTASLDMTKFLATVALCKVNLGSV